MNYTDNLKLRQPEGSEYYDVEIFNANAKDIDTAITTKASKPVGVFTAGNLASLDAAGNLVDGGKAMTGLNAELDGIRLDLLDKVNVDSTIPQWYSPTFLSGSAGYPNENLSAKYGKSGNIVALEGIVSAWINEQTMFYLPEGFRPKYTTQAVAIVTFHSTKGEAQTQMVSIAPDGRVIPRYGNSYANDGNNHWLFLNICFIADNI